MPSALWGGFSYDPGCKRVHFLAGMLFVERGTFSFRV